MCIRDRDIGGWLAGAATGAGEFAKELKDIADAVSKIPAPTVSYTHLTLPTLYSV